MDVATTWGIVGSVAGVAGVVVAVVIAIFEHRRGRQKIADSHLPTGAAITRGDPAAGPSAFSSDNITAIPRQLPRPPVHIFGRDRELQFLDAALDAEPRAPGQGAIFIICGTAGIGKTTLAMHWASGLSTRFPDGQLYANLRGFGPTGSPLAPDHVLVGFLRALDVPTEQIPLDVDELCALYRTVLGGRRALVVLDNARDAAQVRPLLPGITSSIVVVTSRDRLRGLVAQHGAVALMLDVLEDAHAEELLTARLGARMLDSERPAVVDLVRCAGGLPLGLSIVATRASLNQAGALSAMADELRTEQRRLDAFDLGDPEVNVRAVLSWSYLALGLPAARLFHLLGTTPIPDLGTAAAASLAKVPPREARASLGELAEVGLIHEIAPGRFRGHDLVRAYAAEKAADEPPDDARAAVERLLGYYLHSALAAEQQLNPPRKPILPLAAPDGAIRHVPQDYPEAWAWFDAEHGNIIACIQYCSVHDLNEYAWRLAWTLVTFFDRQGRWHEQIATQNIALRSARMTGDRRAEAEIYRLIGQAHGWLGNHQEAVCHLQSGLSLFAELGDARGEARTRYALAWALGERHTDFPAAVVHAKRALDLYRELQDVAWQARTLNAIGWYQAQVGDLSAALTSCSRALALFRGLLVRDRHGEADTLDGLGFVFFRLGDLPAAIGYYRDALRVWRTHHNSYYEADTLHHLGDVLWASGDVPAARENWQSALDILERIRHPDAGSVRAKLDPSAT